MLAATAIMVAAATVDMYRGYPPMLWALVGAAINALNAVLTLIISKQRDHST